jgi:antitoxin (DNA-binding transcriptional repressor) of toxin-antitoxin stability system
MKTATISETKNNLSALLDRVRAGETVLILDRETPVASLEPVRSIMDAGQEARLGRLERKGKIRRGTGKPSRRYAGRFPSVRPPGPTS